MDTLSVWVLRGMVVVMLGTGVYWELTSPIFGQEMPEVTAYRLDDHERRLVKLEAEDIAVIAEKVKKLEWMSGTMLAAILVQLVGRLNDKAKTRIAPRRRVTD